MPLLREAWVIAFLIGDENSRLLSGKKDTVAQKKKKFQRRILTKSLKELHAENNSEVNGTLSLSYRQFLRLRPFYTTESKAHDRNTCACLDHENVKLLVDRLSQSGFKVFLSYCLLLSVISRTRNACTVIVQSVAIMK